jgi:hypothetical protein
MHSSANEGAWRAAAAARRPAPATHVTGTVTQSPIPSPSVGGAASASREGPTGPGRHTGGRDSDGWSPTLSGTFEVISTVRVLTVTGKLTASVTGIASTL